MQCFHLAFWDAVWEQNSHFAKGLEWEYKFLLYFFLTMHEAELFIHESIFVFFLSTSITSGRRLSICLYARQVPSTWESVTHLHTLCVHLSMFVLIAQSVKLAHALHVCMHLCHLLWCRLLQTVSCKIVSTILFIYLPFYVCRWLSFAQFRVLWMSQIGYWWSCHSLWCRLHKYVCQSI